MMAAANTCRVARRIVVLVVALLRSAASVLGAVAGLVVLTARRGGAGSVGVLRIVGCRGLIRRPRLVRRRVLVRVVRLPVFGRLWIFGRRGGLVGGFGVFGRRSLLGGRVFGRLGRLVGAHPLIGSRFLSTGLLGFRILFRRRLVLYRLRSQPARLGHFLLPFDGKRKRRERGTAGVGQAVEERGDRLDDRLLDALDSLG